MVYLYWIQDPNEHYQTYNNINDMLDKIDEHYNNQSTINIGLLKRCCGGDSIQINLFNDDRYKQKEN